MAHQGLNERAELISLGQLLEAWELWRDDAEVSITLTLPIFGNKKRRYTCGLTREFAEEIRKRIINRVLGLGTAIEVEKIMTDDEGGR